MQSAQENHSLPRSKSRTVSGLKEHDGESEKKERKNTGNWIGLSMEAESKEEKVHGKLSHKVFVCFCILAFGVFHLFSIYLSAFEFTAII